MVPMGGENIDPVPREQPALKLVLGLVFSPNEKTIVLSTALEKRVEATQLDILVDLFIPTPFLVLLRDSFILLGLFMLTLRKTLGPNLKQTSGAGKHR